jgi:multimeric flavodoxin WrbA
MSFKRFNLLKVLGVNTSPRKKNTYRMIELVLDGIENPEIEKEIITLSDYKNFKYCLGCCVCLYNMPGECVQDDDVSLIEKKMIEADGIVLGTPVYIMQVSAHLKNLIDRTCRWSHRRPHLGKHGVVVSPIAAPPELAKATMDYMKSWLNIIGVWPIGELPAYAPHTHIDKEDEIAERARELGEKLATYMIEKRRYEPTERDLEGFKRMKMKVQRIGGPDLAWWEKMGWVDEDYYTW